MPSLTTIARLTSAPPTTYRYRQFQELHTSLSALGLSAATSPIPCKYSYKTQDERFVAKRREELEEYLAAVVADRQLRQCAELHQFLELGLLLGQTSAARAAAGWTAPRAERGSEGGTRVVMGYARTRGEM